MVLQAWLTCFVSRLIKKNGQRDRRRRSGRLFTTNHAASCCERLEPRVLLSAITVDSLVDENDGNTTAGNLSLREAIEKANATPGFDQITFAPALANGTIRISPTLGQLVITDDLFIDGKITLDGQSQSRIMAIGKNAQPINVWLNALSYSNGRSDNGGALYIKNTTLSISSAKFKNNNATLFGGSIDIESGAVKLNESELSAGIAQSGGAVYFQAGSLSVNRCAFSGNHVTGEGGAIYQLNGNLDIVASSLTSNQAGIDSGAVINLNGNLRIYNSTISRNAAANQGAIWNLANMTVVNCTIAENIDRSINSAGGIVDTQTGGTSRFYNTILIGSVGDADLSGAVSPDTSNNLIGTIGNGVVLKNGVQGNIIGADFASSLQVLSSASSSRTLAYIPTPWSRAIDAGSNALAIGPNGQPLTLDQRGGTFARTIDGNQDSVAVVDIGSIEAAAFTQPLVVKSLDDDTTILGNPNGQTFSVATLSLREAIAIANLRSGKDTITFDSGLFAYGEQTLFLNGEFAINDDLTMTGPGSELLVLDAHESSRHFSLGIGREFNLSGVTLVNGIAEQGGAIWNAGRHLVLTDVVAANNYSQDIPNNGINPEGAVIYNVQTVADVNGNPVDLILDQNVEITNSRLVGNHSDNFGSLRMFLGDVLTIRNSSFVNNSAYNGGVTANGGGKISVFDSLFIGNTSKGFGGGLRSFGDLVVVGSSFVANQSTEDAGSAIGMGAGNLLVINSTFSGNIAKNGVGAIQGAAVNNFATQVINSTIINNSTIDAEDISLVPTAGGIGSLGGDSSNVKLVNTIVSGNLAANLPSEIYGKVDTVNSFNNLVYDDKSAGGLLNTVNGNKVGVNPKLGPLTFASNQYFASPLPNSPVINSGSTARAVDPSGAPLTTDQRGAGFPRVLSLAVDIGAIEVPVINAAPALSSTTATVNYTENGVGLAINPTLTIVDPDNTTLASGTVTISNFVSGQDVLGFSPIAATMGNITGVFSPVTGVLTLTSSGATATKAQWQVAMRSVTYSNLSDAPTTTARLVDFVVNDGLASSNKVTTSVTITAVNDAPSLTGNATLNYVENDPAKSVNAGLIVTDPDNTTLASATVKLTTFVTGQDVLSFVADPATMGNITGTNSTWSITLVSAGATATTAQWQAALRAVTYQNKSDSPTTTPRTMTFTINDGLKNSLPFTSTIAITAVDDAPTLTSTTPSISYTVNSAAKAINSAIAVADLDNTTLASGKVSIANFVAGQDLLEFIPVAATMGNISGLFNSTTGVMTLVSAGATATKSQWQVALRAVTYRNTSPTPNLAARTVKFSVNDGLVDSTDLISTISIV